jgi:hypothetical protein
MDVNFQCPQCGHSYHIDHIKITDKGLNGICKACKSRISIKINSDNPQKFNITLLKNENYIQGNKNIKKKNTFLLIFCLVGFMVLSFIIGYSIYVKDYNKKQIDTLGKNHNIRLKNQSNQMAKATLNKDYNTILKFMYPSIIEKNGGYNQVYNNVKLSMEEMEMKKWFIDEILNGNPSQIVFDNNEYVAIIPTTIKMRIEQKNVIVNSYLLAISQDNAQNWYFIDGAQMSKEQIATIYPKLIQNVIIPDRTNSLMNEVYDTLREIEAKEGKPFNEVLNDYNKK